MNESMTHDSEALESLVGRVVDEFIDRRDRGEEPDVEDYAQRYPEHAEVIRQVLLALRLVQSAASDSEPSEEPAAEPALRGGCLGDFRIVREVGYGGMGVVYEAEQLSLRRRVALKVLPFAAAIDGRRLQRFRNEAQAAAQLHHSNIVPVYAVGCDRGVHYYAMQLIDGRSLTELIADLPEKRGTNELRADDADVNATTPHPLHPESHPAPPTEVAAALSTHNSHTSTGFFRTVAQLGVQAAEALDYAHQMGVVHRDIKPANLLVDSRGNLWITDFGLAHLQGEANLTMTGDLLGTLRYMSPEQALARRVPIDHRTDIYSLGVTLYELLTRQPAVRGTDRQEVLRQIAFEEPISPRRLNRAIPTELETIILKAMAKNAAERYATAQELADDLRRFLEDRPIRARRPSLVLRARKWYRRHQSTANWVATVAALGMILAVVVLLVKNRDVANALAKEKDALAKEKDANEQKDRVVEERDTTLYWRNIHLAELELSALIPRVAVAEQYLNDCSPHMRGWEWHCLKRKRFGTLTIRPHPRDTGTVPFGVAFSPDSRRVAVVSVNDDRRVLILDAATGEEIGALIRPVGSNPRLGFSPDGRFLAVQVEKSGTGRGIVTVWDLRDNKQLLQEDVDYSVYNAAPAFAFAPDGRLALLDASHTLKVMDPVGGLVLGMFKAPDPAKLMGSVVFNPDGRLLGVTDSNGDIYLWEVASNRERRKLPGVGERITALAFSPDKRLLAAASGAGGAGLWNVETGEQVHTLKGKGMARDVLVFSPDSRFLVSNSKNYHMRIWDTTSGRLVSSPEGDGPSFNPRDGRLAFASGRTVTILDLAARREVLVLHDHEGRGFMVKFSPDSRRLASISTDGTLRIHDATPLEERPGPRTFSPSTGVSWVAYSPDRKHLAAVVSSGVEIWDAETGTGPLQTFELDGASRLAYSPDGTRLAVGSRNGRVSVFDVTTGAVRTYTGHRAPVVITVSWSPDGKHIASATEADAQVWDADTLATILTLREQDHRSAHVAIGGGPIAALARGPMPALAAVAFSPDGRYIAAGVPLSGKIGSQLVVWDRAGNVVARLQEHPLIIMSVAFSPDSRFVATGTFGTTVRVGDIQTGEVRILDGHHEAVFALAFSPDGHSLATGSHDGAVKVWQWRKFPPATPEQISAAFIMRTAPGVIGPEPVTLRGYTDRVWGVAFNHDGTFLAVGAGNPEKGEIVFWDKKHWKRP